MALQEQRLRSADFVQCWVNSIPSGREESSCQLSPPYSYSSTNSKSCSSAPTTCSSDQVAGGSCESVGGVSRVTHSPSRSPSAQVTQQNLNFTPEGQGKKAPYGAADKAACRQALRRKSSRLSWMHSNYSSFNSESSSIDILLEERKTNPEEVLMNLGFGVCDPSLGARLPSRFLANETLAYGVNVQNFLRGHPDISLYQDSELPLAYGEIYTRLPSYYRQVATNEKHTSLHKNFSQSSLDLHNDQSYAPLTMHQSEDGTVFASILTRSNTEQLEKQGFYSEYSSQSSLPTNSSMSSISTNDCTIDSVDTPSPIILNNNPSSPDSCRNPFITTQSSGSDSVFSSTESFVVDQRIRAKLEAIHEKTINEMCDDDLEEGISFVYRRRSDGDLVQNSATSDICEEAPQEKVNIHEKRKVFARLKSRSYDEEMLTQMIKEQLDSVNSKESSKSSASHSNPTPMIVTTDTSQEKAKEPFLPKQCDGLLQVSFNPESFDSVDSDAGTIVPSPFASPCQGMSPSTSRNGSISLLPAMESFELEESCDAGASGTSGNHGENSLLVLPTSKRKRAKLQRSVSERSDSDSSGIADIDCKSTHGQAETAESKVQVVSKSQHLMPRSCSKDGSITSSTLTLTSAVCLAPINANVEQRSRRCSDGDLRFYSASSSISTSARQSPHSFESKPYKDASMQTDDYSCHSCGGVVATGLTEWQTNNLPNLASISSTNKDDKSPMEDACDVSVNAQPTFYITTADDDSSPLRHSSAVNIDCSGESICSSSSADKQTEVKREHSLSVLSTESSGSSLLEDSSDIKAARRSSNEKQVEEIYSEMAQDLKILKELFAKYNINQPASTNFSDDSNGEAVKEHIISSLQLASAALSPTFSPIQSSKHSKSTPVHSKCFKPLTIDCTDSNKLTDAADNLPGSNQPLNATCTKISNYTDSSITCSKLPQETESVISMPNSLSSTPNSRTPSSTASSSNSRLSNQLRLAESKRQYEKKMADLEIQKNKLALQMKDEEIEYWKSCAQSYADDLQ